MGKKTGFKEFDRQTIPDAEPLVRLGHWDEFHLEVDSAHLRDQGARCMDCGVPFCQSETGCPIDNMIPEWNDFVYRGRWRSASGSPPPHQQFPGVHGTCLPGAL